VSKVKRLEKRLTRISYDPNVWIPPWLRAVGSREEITEWKEIGKAYRGEDRYEHRRDFIQRLRARYPDMGATFEEELAREVEKLRRDKGLARSEGLTDEDLEKKPE
jgi:hypothetical protein